MFDNILNYIDKIIDRVFEFLSAILPIYITLFTIWIIYQMVTR